MERLTQIMYGPVRWWSNCLISPSKRNSFNYGVSWPDFPTTPVILVGDHRIKLKDKFIISRPFFRVIVLWDNKIDHECAYYKKYPTHLSQYWAEKLPPRYDRQTIARKLLSVFPSKEKGNPRSRLDDLLAEDTSFLDWIGTGVYFVAKKYIIYRRPNFISERPHWLSTLDREPSIDEWYAAQGEGYALFPFETTMRDLVREVIATLQEMAKKGDDKRSPTT